MQEHSYPSHSDMSDISACIDYIMDFNLTMLKIYKQSAAVWTSLKRGLIAGPFHPVAIWYSRQLPDTALWCPHGVINRHTHSCLVKQLARLGSGCYRGRVITDNIQDVLLTLGFPNSSMIAPQLYPSISQNSRSACCLEGTAKILSFVMCFCFLTCTATLLAWRTSWCSQYQVILGYLKKFFSKPTHRFSLSLLALASHTLEKDAERKCDVRGKALD